MFAKTKNNKVLICAIQLDDSWIEVTEAPESKGYRDTWVLNGTVITEATAEKEVIVAAETKKANKIEGVLFEGILCSAQAEDMWGLSSVEDFILAGNSIPFIFKNGNTLVLTADNFAEFQAVWIPFRLGFFQ